MSSRPQHSHCHRESSGPAAPPCLRVTSSRVSDADCDHLFAGRAEPHVGRTKSSGAVLRSEAKARALIVPPPPSGQPPAAGGGPAAPEDDAPPMCIICYDDFDRRRAPHRVPCACQDAHFENHAFVHYGCIRAWAAQKSSCPLCRASMTVQCRNFVAPANVDLADFVARPLPIEAGVVQCFVRVRLGRGPPVYDLFLEGPPPQRLHLLTATWQLTPGLRSSYAISLPADASRDAPRPIARAVSNLLGTCWSVLGVENAAAQHEPPARGACADARGGARLSTSRSGPPGIGGGRVGSSVGDGGAERTAHSEADGECCDASGAGGAPAGPSGPPSTAARGGSAVPCSPWQRRRGLRGGASKSAGAAGGSTDLAAVGYKANRFCFDSGPRSMSIATPAVTEDGAYEAERLPVEGERALVGALPCARSGAAPPPCVTAFKNRAPVWDDRYEAYVLNFLGRVRVASVKNFQIVQTDNVANETLLQFGRVSSTVFSMDVQWPLSIVQAFGISLTSISTKLGVK